MKLLFWLVIGCHDNRILNLLLLIIMFVLKSLIKFFYNKSKFSQLKLAQWFFFYDLLIQTILISQQRQQIIFRYSQFAEY